MNNNKLFDLEERTLKFGEEIVGLCSDIRETAITRPIISQLVKSGTSVGANYMEANGASSRKDFRNKIYICKKEIQETKHWLRIILKCSKDKEKEILKISQECMELVLIFGKIAGKLK